ncbi:MAG: hypothetical protein H6899_13435 [Rhodobacter sp.]|nr:hypothetical protein [Rhodobacter sp.]
MPQPPGMVLRVAGGLIGLALAVWLGLQPLGDWLTPAPALPPLVAAHEDLPADRETALIASFLQGRRWMAETPDQMRRIFRVRIPTLAAPDETLFLWVPQFEQRLQVLTPSGHVLHDSIAGGFRASPIRSTSALVALPPEILQATGGELDLAVDVDLSRIGALGPVYAGPWSALVTPVLLHRLLENAMRPAMLGALLFLALMSVAFAVLRPRDAVYYWLAGTMIPYAAVELGLILAYVPSLSRIDDQVFAVSGVGTLQLIGLLLTFKDRPPPQRLSSALLATYACLVAATFFMSVTVLVQLTLAMILLTSAFMLAFFLTFGTETRPDRGIQDVALFVALIAFLAGILHDLLLKTGIHPQGIYVFRYVSFVLLAGIFAKVITRQSGVADALDQSNEHLRSRLREQERMLTDYHRREAETLKARTAETERQRITADLHDGMAGYLATIVALSEHQTDDTSEISNLAKDALNDLRFVIDATSVSSPDLRQTLAILRERCLQPLEALKIDLDWSMIDLPDDVHLSHEDNLHILRILQEALNNAVRHGKPTAITVTGRRGQGKDGTTRIELTLENRGGLAPARSRVTPGHGTANMAKRAAALGGSVQVTPLDDGASLRLMFPWTPKHRR